MYQAKSSFNKLHLIGEEMLNRVLPKLSEVEKQELYDLQDRYKPYQDSKDVIPEENDQNFPSTNISKEQIDPFKYQASEEKLCYFFE